MTMPLLEEEQAAAAEWEMMLADQRESDTDFQ
jgi:hypothetical protein